MGKPLEAFRLQLEAAATPERVAAAATFLGRVLRAAHPGLPEGSVTLVVTNYAMDATVRARTPDGRRAAERVLDFLENPTRTLDRDPQAREIAEALAAPGEALFQARILRPRGRKPLVTLNEQFARWMSALARASKAEPALRGTTVIYSPVYRVGRWDEDRATKARLRLDGECHEIALEDEHIAPQFFEAAAQRRVFPVTLSATWIRGTDSRLHYDIGRTRAMRVDLEWMPVTGAAFIEVLQESAPSGFVDEDEVSARVHEIRRRQA